MVKVAALSETQFLFPCPVPGTHFDPNLHDFSTASLLKATFLLRNAQNVATVILRKPRGFRRHWYLVVPSSNFSEEK